MSTTYVTFNFPIPRPRQGSKVSCLESVRDCRTWLTEESLGIRQLDTNIIWATVVQGGIGALPQVVAATNCLIPHGVWSTVHTETFAKFAALDKLVGIFVISSGAERMKEVFRCDGIGSARVVTPLRYTAFTNTGLHCLTPASAIRAMPFKALPILRALNEYLGITVFEVKLAMVVMRVAVANAWIVVFTVKAQSKVKVCVDHTGIENTPSKRHICSTHVIESQNTH
mmetsp:Transcript_2365/g.4121  ORF Transcript_2365/g.4121 Transcript_2365/m.4121 type:complete len:227 (-) Transcript_2365:1049-1729(-)